MKTTYFKVDRDIQNHWLWDDKPFSRGQSWIDLLLMATHTDRKSFHKGQVIDRKRGEVHTSIGFLCNRWGWSKNKVNTFLSQLEKDKMVSIKGTTQGTIVYIEKYAFYQSEYTTKGTTKSLSKGTTEGLSDGLSDGTTEGLQTKKDNKDKELSIMDKKDIKTCNPKYDERLRVLQDKLKRVNDNWRDKNESKRIGY